MSESLSDRPIGVFDSGIGGLSVLRAIRADMPEENLIYLGDQGHVPYGARPVEEIQAFSEGITRYLLARGSKIIVVACNTASAAALKFLREKFPQIPFVGMEPAVKPAAESTQSGAVGVLATPATFQGALYASVLERFAKGVKVYQDTCPGLVAQIEAGDLSGPRTREILEKALFPMLEKHIDTIVLGCTHYPFVIPLIQEIAGRHVRVIDPAPAVSKQTYRLLTASNKKRPDGLKGRVQFLTTGSADAMEPLLPLLFGESGKAAEIHWRSEVELDAQQTESSSAKSTLY